MLRDSITDVERFHNIMLSSYYGISIWIYKSLKHRMWKRPPERAQRASLTSSVHSYLRSSYGGRSARGRVLRFLRRPHQPFIILSISHVREISLLVLSVLWISIWIYKSLEHRLRTLPLFHLPSILTLCSFASLFRLLRRSILTAVMLFLRFYHFYSGTLLTLPFIMHLFYRWPEMTHITTFRSHFSSLYTP